MGVLDGLITLVPMYIAHSRWIDYGHVTLVRVSSVVFPLLLDWSILSVSQVMGTLLIAASLLFGSYAGNTLVWPRLSWGIGAALACAAGASLLGTLQRRYFVYGWNPRSRTALYVKGVQLAVIGYAAVNTTEPIVMDSRYPVLWVCYILQTWAINRFFLSHKKQTGAFVLGVTLAFKKLLTIFLYTDWTHLYNTSYVASIACGGLALMCF
jgi:hypothetical protein